MSNEVHEVSNGAVSVAPGILRSEIGIYYFSPATILLAAKEGDGSEVVASDQLAVLLGRLVTRAMDAEEAGREAAR